MKLQRREDEKVLVACATGNLFFRKLFGLDVTFGPNANSNKLKLKTLLVKKKMQKNARAL